MKLNFIILIFAGLFFASCGDDASCEQADWVGTYSGTIDCPDEDPEDVEYVITAGATDTELLFDGEAVPFDGCSISLTETDPFFGIEITLNLELDGNNLNGTVETSIAGISASCSVITSK